MYHNTILADMIDLYQLSLVYPDLIPHKARNDWGTTIEKMFEWAEVMQHPDGDVSFLMTPHLVSHQSWRCCAVMPSNSI